MEDTEARGVDRFSLLALDDSPQILSALRRLLRPYGFDSTGYTDPHEALGVLAQAPQTIDVVVLDMKMPEMDGIEVLGKIRAIDSSLPVVMLTGDETAQTAVSALQAGAFSYLTKPISDPAHIAHVLKQAATHRQLDRRARQLEERLANVEQFQTLVGTSTPMRQLYERIDRVASAEVSVLVRGESGTGKELIARAIHDRGNRKDMPFVALNCAAIPDTLVDSELFGHTRGAFTGATSARAGAFERASGGTLFLDEIGDISMPVQRRLLRVLQEGEVQPLGSDEVNSVDVRVIAATLVDLDEAVADGTFRGDLFYRLNVVSIIAPPLRERIDDVPVLAAHFIKKHAARMDRSPVRLTIGAVEALCRYDWPGNVRELENLVQRLLALFPDDEIDEDALPASMISPSSARMPAVVAAPRPAINGITWADDMTFAEAAKAASHEFERAYAERALERTDGNITQAAKLVGLDRSNFKRVLDRAGVRRKPE